MAADKRELILLAAIKLFAEKGFHSTSIQEIADAAGVAKGSTYLYFKSKEDILLSVFNDYYARMLEDIMNTAGEGMTTRERITSQIRMQLEKFSEFRDFIKMQMREQFFHQSEELKQAAIRMRLRGTLWLMDRVRELYGEEIRPYALDLTHMFQSLIGGYMGTMIMHNVQYELDDLAEFLMGRLDDLAYGLLKSQAKPMFDETALQEYMRCMPSDDRETRLQQLFRSIRELLEQQPQDGAPAEDLLDSVRELEQELQKPKPKRIIVQGMLSLLQQSGISALKKPVRRLQAEVDAALERAAE